MVGKRAEFDDAGCHLPAVGAGDEVANHTWSHHSLRNLDATSTALQIDRAQAMLTAESGHGADLRAARAEASSMRRASWRSADRGLIMVLWSIHANDIEPSPAPRVLVKNALQHIKPGSIVLMHETNPNTVRRPAQDPQGASREGPSAGHALAAVRGRPPVARRCAPARDAGAC